MRGRRKWNEREKENGKIERERRRENNNNVIKNRDHTDVFGAIVPFAPRTNITLLVATRLHRGSQTLHRDHLLESEILMACISSN